MGSFNHNGYVENIISEPVARACEAIETTRKLLASKKRWHKGHLSFDSNGITSYCLHGALGRVLRGHPVYLSAPRQTGPLTLSPDNTPEANAVLAIAIAISENPWWAERAGSDLHKWPADSIVAFNDSPNTTHDDIKAVLKRAKAICYEHAMTTGEDGGF
jgi:hypothetical protein